eukprot:394833-Hanusia_phi.AAC.1
MRDRQTRSQTRSWGKRGGASMSMWPRERRIAEGRPQRVKQRTIRQAADEIWLQYPMFPTQKENLLSPNPPPVLRAPLLLHLLSRNLIDTYVWESFDVRYLSSTHVGENIYSALISSVQLWKVGSLMYLRRGTTLLQSGLKEFPLINHAIQLQTSRDRVFFPRSFQRLLHRSQPRYFSNPSDHGARKVEIGDVQVHVGVPANPHLVPVNYGRAEDEDEETLHHLRWMLQKFQLGQVIFLCLKPRI